MGDEIAMATGTSAAWSTRGMWEGNLMPKRSKVEGIALRVFVFSPFSNSFFFFYGFEGDSHGCGPSTRTNEPLTEGSHVPTLAHTPLHHRFWTGYITRPARTTQVITAGLHQRPPAKTNTKRRDVRLP